MATVVLNVEDETLLTQIKKACMLLKGVASVKVQKNAKHSEDITKTAHYRRAMEDVEQGRVSHYDSVDDLFKDLGIEVK